MHHDGSNGAGGGDCSRTVAFILSSDRSGSTWVGYVLGSNSNSAFLGEFRRAWSEDLRQPCSWCAVRGQGSCEVLAGAEGWPAQRAFEFAFSRIPQQFLIDISKRVEWACGFLAPDSPFGIRLIHLIRDPRGWVASQRRRQPSAPLPGLLKEWLDENVRIRDFLELNAPFKTVFYEELAAEPHSEFTNLCEFIGFPFEQGSLKYWERVHHGYAANGATSLFLPSQLGGSRLTHFVTGDDSYYETQGRTSFVDVRWKQELSEAEILSITEDPEVAALLSHYDRLLSPHGLQRLRDR
jgi:hypothetical protein